LTTGSLIDMEQWLEVAMEEYKTLRQESLAAIEQMQRTLQIGLVAIGVVTAFGVDAVKEGTGVQVGPVCFTPAFAAVVVLVSLDELRRAMRAGAHIARLEHKLKWKYPNDPPLTWESKEVGFRPVRHWAATVALFAATTPAVVLGLHKLCGADEWGWFRGALAAALLALVITLWYQRRVHGEIKRQFTKELKGRPEARERPARDR